MLLREAKKRVLRGVSKGNAWGMKPIPFLVGRKPLRFHGFRGFVGLRRFPTNDVFLLYLLIENSERRGRE